MSILDIIDRRIAVWQVNLSKAEGRYHTAARKGTEQERNGCMAECRRCQAVLCELEDLREEVRACEDQ